MFNVNWKHFIIKLHYFFLYGGLTCPLQSRGTAGSHFGMSSMAFRITFLISRLSICISQPVVGFITDKHGNIRNTFMVLLIITGVILSAVVYIPPVEKRGVQSTELTLACNKQRDEMVLHLSTYEYDTTCYKEMAMDEYSCKLLSHCFKDTVLSGSLKLTNNLTNILGTRAIFFKFHGKNITIEDCNCLEKNMSQFTCPDYSFSVCNSFARITPEYEMYNFWIFVFLYSVAQGTSEALFFLMDATCLEILDKKSNDFGKQRLWGSVGWVIIYFASGYYSSYYLSEQKTRYFIGNCIMLGFFFKNMFLLYVYPLKKSYSSASVCKNLIKTFFSVKPLIFLFGIIVCGAFSGLLITCRDMIAFELDSSHYPNYQEYGTDKLWIAFRYLVEVLCFFFSGWFVKKCGHFCCLMAALVMLTVGMGLCSVVNNPWWILLIEILENIIYAVSSSSMILYAVQCSLPGTEATTLGIFQATYDGLGLTLGLFSGIITLNEKSVRWISFVASMVLLSIVPVLSIFYVFISRRKAK